MRETERKEIEGHNYVCTMMPVRTAHRTWLDLCASIGQPALQAIARGFDEKDGEDQDVVNLIISALGIAVQNLEGDIGERLLTTVFDGVHVVDSSGDIVELKPWDDKFNDHFQGRMLTMYKVWAWSVEVNYRDFLDAARNLGGDRAKNLGKSVLQTLLTPTSGSGTSSGQSN